eukprot:8717948-Karenia_brevis.AAC.1
MGFGRMAVALSVVPNELSNPKTKGNEDIITIQIHSLFCETLGGQQTNLVLKFWRVQMAKRSILDPILWSGPMYEVQNPLRIFTESPYGYDGEI